MNSTFAHVATSGRKLAGIAPNSVEVIQVGQHFGHFLSKFHLHLQHSDEAEQMLAEIGPSSANIAQFGQKACQRWSGFDPVRKKMDNAGPKWTDVAPSWT